MKAAEEKRKLREKKKYVVNGCVLQGLLIEQTKRLTRTSVFHLRVSITIPYLAPYDHPSTPSNTVFTDGHYIDIIWTDTKSAQQSRRKS